MLLTSRLLVLALLATVAAALAPARAPKDPLNVVATIPDLADIASAIGGERVEVTSICRGKENLHKVTARPSHLVAMSRADVFVQVGMSLEAAFAGGLLEQSRNPRIRPGQPGFVTCSAGWEAIGVPADLSRKGGDLHPEGNPHLNLDPRGGRHIAARIHAALAAIDPGSKELYARNHAAWLAKLEVAEKRWAELGAAWKGEEVVVYHQEFDYLCAAYGISIVGTIETKPGIPPTPNHVAELVATMKREGCRVILTAPWSNGGQVERVAEASGARIVELPNLCGGSERTATWIGMQDLVHERLAKAFAAPESPR
jgi:zinc/manganese transport system substrate-binding protein